MFLWWKVILHTILSLDYIQTAASSIHHRKGLFKTQVEIMQKFYRNQFNFTEKNIGTRVHSNWIWVFVGNRGCLNDQWAVNSFPVDVLTNCAGFPQPGGPSCAGILSICVCVTHVRLASEHVDSKTASSATLDAGTQPRRTARTGKWRCPLVTCAAKT